MTAANQPSSSIREALEQACTPRETQIRLADFLDRWRSGVRPVAAVQADTGTGKTRVLLAAAKAFVAAGKPVVISVSTLALTRQIEEEAKRFDWGAALVGRRLGVRSYVSPARVYAHAGRLAANGATEETLAQLAELAAFAQADTGLIEDWLERFGAIPGGLEPDDIALLPSARKADKAVYAAAREAAKDLDIAIQTHALTLMQARSGEIAPVLLFDEADTLAGIADGAEDRQLSLRDVAALLDVAEGPQPAKDALAKLRDKPDSVQLREALADQLRFPNEDEAVRLALSDARRVLTAHRLDAARRGTEVRRARDDIVIRSLWAGRGFWTWENLKEAGCERAVFASATLSIGSGPAQGLRALGVKPDEVSETAVAPDRFGTMRFRLTAKDAVPPAKADGQGLAAWRNAAASFMASALEPGKRTLVLTTSFDDAAWIAGRFGIRAHRRGEKLHVLAQDMRAWRIDRLVTPSGWVGLDLPGVLTDIVIWKLPYAAPDELRADLVGAPSFIAVNENMLRKLRQGLGRGIRQATDEVTVWIADPRLYDPRQRVGSAVPARFQPEWQAAFEGRPERRQGSAQIRPEQQAFRDAVLEADRFRCVVTGCNVVSALDAAHRPGRDWRLGHNRAEDGWTLRVDLHRLLDAGELRIDDGSVWVAPSARETYGEWHGRRIAHRTNDQSLSQD
jgi:Rad3-related DNA helicase